MASLTAQTFRDFEIIIVNDGSNDPITIRTLAALDRSVRVIHQNNLGPAAARNTGFARAAADIILALDCDDQLKPSYLEETVSVLRSSPEVDFVFTHMQQVGALQNVEKRYVNEFDVLFKNVTGYALLMRKSVWQKVGRYDETLTDGYEDWEFNLRLITLGYKGVEIPKPLFIYAVSSHGMLMSRSTRKHSALWALIRKKHPDLYQPKNLVATYWRNRNVRTEISPIAAIGALCLARILPVSVYSAIIRAMRNYRLYRSRNTCTVQAENIS